MDTTEAANLARIILDDSEADLPNDLYPLNVREARTLARAVLNIADYADRLDAEAELIGEYGGAGIITACTTTIRAALNGDAA